MLEYLAAAHERFQDWSRPVLLSAGIYDQLGNDEMALKTYLEAIRLGEVNPKAVLRTVELLRQRHQFSEANELIEKMEERRMPLTQELGRSAVEVALQQKEDDRAYDLLNKLHRGATWKEEVWEGQVLAYIARRAERDGRIPEAEKKFSQAEKAFRRAIAINDKVPEAWMALVAFLTGLNKDALTKKAMEDVEDARAHLPPKESHLAFAQMYEALGKSHVTLAQRYASMNEKEHARSENEAALKDQENAQKEYEAAYAIAPDDPTNIRSLADFYLRREAGGRPAPAAKTCRPEENDPAPTAFGAGGNSP